MNRDLPWRTAVFALGLGLTCGCTETSQTRARAALVGRGVASTSFVEDGYTVVVDRADVAIGPLYFCATRATSSELCETAVLEVREAFTFDALDPTDQPLGTLEGVTGAVRTAQYDHGLAFPLAASEPIRLPGATTGHSVVLEGRATGAGPTYGFRVELDVAGRLSGQTALVGRPAVFDVDATGTTVAVVVDGAALLAGADFAALDPGDGSSVVVAPGSLSFDTILRNLTTNAPARFERIDP